MRRDIQRGAEWLVSTPWALLAVVVVAVAVPILLLGELSAADMQRRLRTERLTLGAQAAEQGAEVIQTQLSLSRQRLQQLADDPTLIAAVEARDKDSVPSALGPTTFGGELTDISAIDVADVAGTVLATVTSLTGLTGGTATPSVRSVADREYFKQALAGASAVVGVTTEPLSIDHPVVIAVPISRSGNAKVGVILGEIRGADLAHHLRSQLGPFEDLYVVDGRGWLVGRAAAAGAVPVELRSDPVTRQLLAGARVAGELRDPATGTTGTLNSAPVGLTGNPGWSVVAVQVAGGVEAETGAVLAQQRALRVALVAIVLFGSFAFARIAARSRRQREMLAAALGQVEATSSELAAASRHKSEFLANMSHELRTPLNAIIGFSDVLEQRMFGSLNDQQSEYVRDIAGSGRHLLQLVNEILDLAKVEAGRMDLEPSEFALADTIRGALAFVRERAAGHRIELSAQLPEDLGMLVADERKIRQVLLNLLSNAVKFTPDGGRVSLRAQRSDGEIEVAVQDTGIGIAPADQPTVFEEFRQVGTTSDRSREGTGLGLTLAKRFIELHGGRIWVASEVGTGTTFTFAIPLDRPAVA